MDDDRRAVEKNTIEGYIQEMKAQSEIQLESTRHYVMPDPEDVDSVYDTCDVLGPWHELDDQGKLTALKELDWSRVHPDDRREIVGREVDLARVDPDAAAEFLGGPAAGRDDVEDREMDEEGRSDRFFAELQEVRHTTRDLVHSILMDAWPRPGAIVDFGLDSQRHYEALYYPIREHEISPKQLDDALGRGDRLTELANAAAANPHKNVAFHTSWDVMREFAEPDDRGASSGPGFPEPEL